MTVLNDNKRNIVKRYKNKNVRYEYDPDFWDTLPEITQYENDKDYIRKYDYDRYRYQLITKKSDPRFTLIESSGREEETTTNYKYVFDVNGKYVLSEIKYPSVNWPKELNGKIKLINSARLDFSRPLNVVSYEVELSDVLIIAPPMM